ncbi:uncharacterized protein LOC122266718 [Penaeus japonicus]|uniref:uncharacterized protein LOC122266718 n=1 Tax=Penaeus japonicus TaxID=27405 RepID=UPI001C70C94D|nr:uncharacterized protein LOC122266718 [Penaeus japonicus]
MTPNTGLRGLSRPQVVEPVRKRVVANVSAVTPEFSIGDLAPGLDYVVQVFAYNKRGRSTPYLLDGFSLKVAENRMDSGSGGPSTGASPLLALFVGVVAAFVLTLAVIIVVTKLRCRARASAQDRGEVAAAARGDESEEEDLRGLSASRARDGRRSSVEVKLMSVMRHDEEDLADDVLKQQAKTRVQEHDPSQEYTRLESKTTSESLYSSCSSNRNLRFCFSCANICFEVNMPVPIYISSHFMYIVALQDLYSYGSTSRSNSAKAKVAKVFLSGAQVRRCTFSGCGFVLKRVLAVVSGLVYSLASHRTCALVMNERSH